MQARKLFRYLYMTTLLLLLGIVINFLQPQAKLNVKPNEAGYFDNGGIMNEALNTNESLAPRNPGFYCSSLLRWSPEVDPDAAYSRSTIPLRKGRFYGPQVNPLAKLGAKIQTWSNNTIVSNSQGFDSSSDYAFTHWQYLDSLVGWGVGGGLFCIPQAHLVDAAHKNGVPVTALIGFPTGSHKDGQQEFGEFIQKDSHGNYPIADKMAEVATYYGFDGYVYNQECSGISSAQAKELYNFHMYFRKRYPHLIFNWYDSMTVHGSISYQNTVNSNNDYWIKTNNDLKKAGVNRPFAMDDIFVNYNWGQAQVNTSYNTMINGGRSPFDVYHPFEIQQNSWLQPKPGHTNDFANLLGPDNKLKVSLGFFCSDSTVNISSSLEHFHDIETRFWGTSTKDPRLEPNIPGPIQGEAKWAGMARYVCDKSVINKLPFVTNFQTGHGDRFFVDGKLANSRPWTYKGLQDIAPTWTWMIDTDNKAGNEMIAANGNRRPDNLLNPSYDFSDAFWGGNTIKFDGKVMEANNGQQIKLYATKINQTQDTEVEFVYKEANDQGKTKLNLLISRGSDYSNWTRIELVDRKEINGWKYATCVIPRSDEIINGIGLRVVASEDLDNYSLKLGQLNLKGEIDPLDKIKNLIVDDVKAQSALHANVRLKAKYSSAVMRYEVYKHEKDGSWTFVKASPNSAIYLDNVFHNIDDGQTVELKMVPVDFNNERRNELEAYVTLPWKKIEQTNKSQNFGRNIAVGSRIWWTNSRGGASERIENVFDGTCEGFRKFTIESSYLSLNFIFEPNEVADVNQIWVGLGNLDDGPNASSKYNTKSFKIWYSDEIEEVSGGGSDYSQNEDRSWEYKKKYQLKNKKLAFESNNDQSQGVWKHLDTPIKAKYWEYETTQKSGSYVSRLFEIYLWTGSDKVMSPAVNMSNVTLERTGSGLCNIEFKNVLKNSVISLYRDINDETPIITKHTYRPSGTPYSSSDFRDKRYSDLIQDVKFTDVNIGTDEGSIYFSVKHVKLDDSNRYGIKYFREGVAISEPILQSDLEISPYKIDYLIDGTSYQFVNVKVNNVLPGDIVYIYEGAVDKDFITDRWNPNYDQMKLDFYKRVREVVVGEGKNYAYFTGVCTGVEYTGRRDVMFKIIRQEPGTGKSFAISDPIILDLKHS